MSSPFVSSFQPITGPFNSISNRYCEEFKSNNQHQKQILKPNLSVPAATKKERNPLCKSTGEHSMMSVDGLVHESATTAPGQSKAPTIKKQSLNLPRLHSPHRPQHNLRRYSFEDSQSEFGDALEEEEEQEKEEKVNESNEQHQDEQNKENVSDSLTRSPPPFPASQVNTPDYHLQASLGQINDGNNKHYNINNNNNNNNMNNMNNIQTATTAAAATPTTSFPRPPTNILSHGYQSSISSVSSNGSSHSSPGLLNYSPKHSRKFNSFHLNRNTKNLSLNLNSHDASRGSSLDASISSSLKRPHFQNNGTNMLYTEDALHTPSVTQTPPNPPAIAQFQSLSNSEERIRTRKFKFPMPPTTENENDQISSTSSIRDGSNLFANEHTLPSNFFPDMQAPTNLNLNTNTNTNTNANTSKHPHTQTLPQPPPPPPFALHSKSSPLSTPPMLQSPTQAHHNATPTKLLQNIKKMSIESPLETNFSKEITQSTHSLQLQLQLHLQQLFLLPMPMPMMHTPQNITYKFKSMIPEELQESSAINAYPKGPRNVLNDLIFLYSDPINKIDLNDYNLIINVAKECKNLSSTYHNQHLGEREYIHVPWSHTSNISKDLSLITEKIDEFYSKGLKVLVHCQCGVSRSACVIVAFYMMKFGMGVNEAYEMLKNGNTERVISKDIEQKELVVVVDKCDRICPNMSLIFELMEFGDKLNKLEFSTSQLLIMSPLQINL